MSHLHVRVLTLRFKVCLKILTFGFRKETVASFNIQFFGPSLVTLSLRFFMGGAQTISQFYCIGINSIIYLLVLVLSVTVILKRHDNRRVFC